MAVVYQTGKRSNFWSEKMDWDGLSVFLAIGTVVLCIVAYFAEGRDREIVLAIAAAFATILFFRWRADVWATKKFGPRL